MASVQVHSEDPVTKLDQAIVSDPYFGPETLDRLRVAQRQLGLLHGDRVTCPFLRPYILPRADYQQIKTAAEKLAKAFEKVAHEALRNRELLKFLHLTPREEEMARIEPGYEPLCVTSRLDSYLTPESFQFLEYNAETPAGVGDQMQLEKVLFSSPLLERFLKENRHWSPQPHLVLLKSLLTAYREWGGDKEYPQIGIIDWNGVPTGSEFVVLRDYFKQEGYETVIADPHDLSYDNDCLRVGDFRIDILYKRVIIHEFLREFNREHPIVRAYQHGRICVANSFRTKLVHKKASFAILSDPSYGYLFDPLEIDLIRKHIPWTRNVAHGRTIFEDVECDLMSLLKDQRKRFVLKPNDDYGGQGVVLGWETDPDEWERAIEIALQKPYVVQERVPTHKISMPTFSDRVTLEEMYTDFNPFLFRSEVEGALIRLSSSSLLNVTAGGGETALLVLEDSC